MRILHISDLHIQEKLGVKAEPILERFKKFIENNLRSDENVFDHIVISGDLRNAKNNPKVSDVVKIVDDIATSANITKKECVHIVPGNHDLDRGTQDDINKITNIRQNAYDSNHGLFMNSSDNVTFMLKRFNGFFGEFCKSFYGDAHNPWKENEIHSVVLDEEKKSAFIYLNSCITYIDSNNKENLVIGSYDFLKLIESFDINKVKNIFICSHFSTHNFNTNEADAIRNIIKRKCSKKNVFWLCGDAHSESIQKNNVTNIYRAGSLLSGNLIPEFAVYEIDSESTAKNEILSFKYIAHLNNSKGGWKRIYT